MSLAPSVDEASSSMEHEQMSSASSSTSDEDSDRKITFPPEIEKNVSGQCTFCRKMLYIAELPSDKVTTHIILPIGHIDEMLAADCLDHNKLLQTFRDDLKLGEKTATSTLFMSRDYWASSFSFVHKSSLDMMALFLGFTPQINVLGGDEGLGLSLDIAKIDPRVITEWYSNCINHHCDACARPEYLKYLPNARPEYLIDVVDNCLVPVDKSAVVPAYAALSYVWGMVPMLRATLSNIADLEKPGSLEVQGTELPRTVRHAMYVTANLIPNLRYVWADALCIVQDNPDMLHRHLPQMGSIYAHAAVVIAAISGDDAAHGLRGISNAPMSVPRDLPEATTVRLGRTTLIQRRQKTGQNPDLRYFNRGWTFQEHFFARRSLLFDSSRGISFECCVSRMDEDHKKPNLTAHTMSQGRDFIMEAGYPSLTVLSNVIENFNERELSFPQDCQLAFAGVMPCFRHIFSGGFVAGMPAMFIDAALLWQPSRTTKRRVATGSGTQQNGGLPSWSWIGWQGLLDFEGWFAGNDFVAACSGLIASAYHEIVSTTEWYVCDEPNSARTRVRCLWTEWRERYKDESIDLPDGWTRRPKRRHETFTCPDAPKGYGEYVYQYQGSLNPTFWYPIPLEQDIAVAANTITKDVSSDAYLCGQVGTVTAYLSGTVRHIEYAIFDDVFTHQCICLENDEGQWIGVLRIPADDYLEQKGIDQGAEVQLIAISEGFIPDGKEWAGNFIDEYDMEERPRSDEGQVYEFVNVLWITWDEIDGHQVARREALGRVAKVYWEMLRPRTIDIVLG